MIAYTAENVPKIDAVVDHVNVSITSMRKLRKEASNQYLHRL